jgi:hypothetical protein
MAKFNAAAWVDAVDAIPGVTLCIAKDRLGCYCNIYYDPAFPDYQAVSEDGRHRFDTLWVELVTADARDLVQGRA